MLNLNRLPDEIENMVDPADETTTGWRELLARTKPRLYSMTINHHWDFVDEDGCLHCNCGIGVIPPRPGSVQLKPLNMHGHANTCEEELQEVVRERDGLQRSYDLSRELSDKRAKERDDAYVELEQLKQELRAIKDAALREERRHLRYVDDLTVAMTPAKQAWYRQAHTASCDLAGVLALRATTA